jgi:transposase
MPQSRPPYPAEFRRQMVELVQSGRTPGELSREFGVTSQSISAWVAQAAADSGKPLPGKDVLSTAEREELARLRRQVKRLEQERDILANDSRDVPRPFAKKQRAPTLLRRPDPRPLAFWRLVTP